MTARTPTLAQYERAERRRQLRAFLSENRAFVAGNVLVWTALFVGGYGLGQQEGRAAVVEADRRTAHADSLVARCLASADDAVGSALLAIGGVRWAERYASESAAYADFFAGRVVVAEGDR